MRMMSVSDENNTHQNKLTTTSKLALVHFIAASIAMILMCAVWYSSMWGGSGYYSLFFDFGFRPVAYVTHGHVINVNYMFLHLYAYLLLLFTVHSVIVGIGLLEKKQWVWRWSRITPVMSIPLWVPLTWYTAEYFTLARNNYRVCSDGVSNPLITMGDIRTAALYTALCWLIISIVYWFKLKKAKT